MSNRQKKNYDRLEDILEETWINTKKPFNYGKKYLLLVTQQKTIDGCVKELKKRGFGIINTPGDNVVVFKNYANK